MLCPNCGVDVGEEPRLCEKCAAANDSMKPKEADSEGQDEVVEEETEDTEEQGEEEAASGDSTENAEVEDDEKSPETEAASEPVSASDTAAKSSKKLLIIVGMLGAAVLIGVTALFLLQGREEIDLFLPEAEVVSPQAAEVVSGQPSLRESVLQIGIEKLSFIDSLSLYNPVSSVLEIGFFREPLSDSVRSRVEQLSSIKELAGLQPDVLLILQLENGAEICSRDAVLDYRMLFPKGLGGIASGTEIILTQRKEAIVDLACTLRSGTQISALLKDEQEHDAKSLQWDLSVEGMLKTTKKEHRLHYGSGSAKSTVAIWDKKSRRLEVGFFDGPVAFSEKQKMRKTKSLSVLSKTPTVVLSMDLREENTKLQVSNLVNYGVRFYRNAEAGNLFPGKKDYVGFFFVAGGDRTRQIHRLRGFLKENELIEGSLRYTMKKELQEVPFVISWDLDFDAAVIDVFSEAGADAESESLAEVSLMNRKGPYAQIRAGRSMMEAKTALALFYPSEGDIAVGLYGFELSEEEKEKVRRKRYLSAFVNNKRPNMVIFLNFERSAKTANQQSLLEYTIYFYRDKIGSFHFPGQYESRSFTRMKVEIKPDEIEKLKGDLRDGGVLELKMRGSHLSKRIGERFRWDLNISAPIMSVPSRRN